MTRDQITTLATSTVGQTDATTVALCNDYVQRDYELCWNAELWRDTLTIDTTATITAGNNTFNLPSGFDRIVSIQALQGGTPVGYLDPTTLTYVLQADPTALTVQGVPTKYEEFVHTDGTKKVRIFPLANGSYSFTMQAKRTCPTLAGSDSLQIRNIDNAVIAYVIADLYTRLRQLGKAKEMAEKAGAFLEEARKAERETNKPRVAKVPTVTTNTLAELIDAVCLKANSWVPDSVILARNFIRRRYRFIWDKNLWKESLITATANTTGSQSYVAMPAGMERVISITCDGKLLDPVDTPSFMQTNPGAFSGTGTPVAFEEYDDAGTKKIRLLPTPSGTNALILSGKKTITNLTSDTDVSAIRNIDNALIALAGGDLQARLGDMPGAQASWEEGQKELASVIDLEAQQTRRARMAKPLTVAGDSLSEMTDAVCARTGKWELDQIILIKDCLRRNYKTVWDACLWRESQIIRSVTSDGSFIVLPEDYDTVLKVRGNASLGPLDGVDLSYYFAMNPQIFEETATDPVFFSLLSPVAVSTPPSTAEALTFVSASAADKTPIFIMGEDSTGNQVSETVTLNGTTPVTSTRSYAIPLTIAKQITTGVVTVTGAVSSTTYQTLQPNERERKHIRLAVGPKNPGVTMSCLVLGKRKIKPLLSDEDTPLLRGVGNLLISMTIADVTKDQGAIDKAQMLLKTMVDKEQSQSGIVSRVVPEVEYIGINDPMSSWADLAYIAK